MTNTYREILKSSGIAALIAVNISAIGMVELFGRRELIGGILTMGQVLFLAPAIAMGYLSARKYSQHDMKQAALSGAIHGLLTGLGLALLIFVASSFNIREYLINVSPVLVKTLTFGLEPIPGSILLILISTLASTLASLYLFLPTRIREPLLTGLVYTLAIGLFSEILSERVRKFFGIGVERIIFVQKALSPWVAAILFLLIAGAKDQWSQRGAGIQTRLSGLNPQQKKYMTWATYGLWVVLGLLLPQILGTYLSEVVNNVGIYVLMGLGLNIVVGFAGMLVLGHVAFFAIGAYVLGVLTSTGSLGIAQMSFWAALPFAMLAATIAGVVLVTPVLRMRGDYLAIVTLGFGEIIRILALSDMLKPNIGGAQGILLIPKPNFLGTDLIRPEFLYYVILLAVIISIYISVRLRDSRLGRQWMAMREDEDVAQAMGINLVSTKLLAFGIGAALSGLAGGIFASKLTSIFPHSFNLLISINVLALIIVGGMGSIPGVIVGAFILVGLPELLREFAEFRLLMYGVLLIVMMLAKPEGFWPSAVMKRELSGSAPPTGNEAAAAD